LFLKFFITTVMPRVLGNSKSPKWQNPACLTDLNYPTLAVHHSESAGVVWAPNERGFRRLTPQRRKSPIKAHSFAVHLGNRATNLHVRLGSQCLRLQPLRFCSYLEPAPPKVLVVRLGVIAPLPPSVDT
jgi:hypothetical protein